MVGKLVNNYEIPRKAICWDNMFRRPDRGEELHLGFEVDPSAAQNGRVFIPLDLVLKELGLKIKE